MATFNPFLDFWGSVLGDHRAGFGFLVGKMSFFYSSYFESFWGFLGSFWCLFVSILGSFWVGFGSPIIGPASLFIQF